MEYDNMKYLNKIMKNYLTKLILIISVVILILKILGRLIWDMINILQRNI